MKVCTFDSSPCRLAFELGAYLYLAEWVQSLTSTVEFWFVQVNELLVILGIWLTSLSFSTLNFTRCCSFAVAFVTTNTIHVSTYDRCV